MKRIKDQEWLHLNEEKLSMCDNPLAVNRRDSWVKNWKQASDDAVSESQSMFIR